MGDEEPRAEAQVSHVNGYMIQWGYPGQWFDEIGAMALSLGQNSALGVDIAGRADIDRNNKDELARAIIDSGLSGYD